MQLLTFRAGCQADKLISCSCTSTRDVPVSSGVGHNRVRADDCVQLL